ncbi:hypothetical protein SAMN05444050_4526 [Afipia sp. GAS231]|nr:hypothetical protein SAMN05444050_4526 [Afipia sp. GAS231]
MSTIRGATPPSPPRHCERSEAIHRAAVRKNGLPRRFAPRNDVARHPLLVSRRDAPGVLQEILALDIRGRREDRVRAAPAVSYAIVATRFAHEHTGLAEASGLPCAMALRLIRDRPGDPAFCDTIALGQRWLPSNLTPASGRRTQTISPYVKTTLVSRDLTSTAPCPSFATMANAPCVQKIWQNERTGGCGPTARCWN